jgi:hypothetical protein
MVWGQDVTSAETGVVEDVHTTKAGMRETPQADAKDMEGVVTLTCEDQRCQMVLRALQGGTLISPWTNLVRG